ncbi:unnamed protein product [Phytophthora lilii]|uniref:Unnamed protein product n=1 Tax=Phytophthora lilii TaxID=2077276 RepID=A0A9W6UDN3_9STRA|nr:unnamed protein product [Phytophthora lilii]
MASDTKGRKWQKSSGASRLLRKPPSQRGNELCADVGNVRPQSCPTSKLTPQLHWNLNNSALKAISKAQVEELYGLFKFYDSSTAGDALPSINCSRLIEVFRDAGLLGNNNSDYKGLQVECIERIFAQAVMGKMRVYLDADGQPALTFPLFCGALMNCAMSLTPSVRPETGLRQMLPLLLESSTIDTSNVLAEKGLICHLPTVGTMSLWAPEEAFVLDAQADPGKQDFRESLPFQQVIADCECDIVAEEAKQAKLIHQYQVPGRLVASFHPDTLELISNKFRVFDTFDRGTLPRHEVFALLSSMGTLIDLPDPYAVLAKLSALNTLPPHQPGGRDSSGELTLAQLLQAIELAREAKRHSATAQLAAMKIRMDRAATAVRGSDLLINPSMKAPTDDDNNERDVQVQKAHVRNKRSTAKGVGSFIEQGRKQSLAVLDSRKAILSQADNNTVANNSSQVTRSSNQRRTSKASVTHHASLSDRKKTVFQQRSSVIANNQAGPLTVGAAHSSEPQDDENKEPAMSSLRSSACNTTARDLAVDTQRLMPLDCKDSGDGETDSSFRELQYELNPISVQVHEPPTGSNSKSIRIFLLLGGDHDGAIYCTISLVFDTKEIIVSEGTYYRTAPNESTRTVPVLPVQKTFTNALRMLKKSVHNRLACGFEQRPAGQLDIVDEMLQNLWQRQPHFSSPITKTLRGRTSTTRDPRDQGLVASTQTQLQRAGLARVSSAPPNYVYSMVRRGQKLPRHSKSLHHQRHPNNYSDLLETWGISQSNDYSWVHQINAASPLKQALPSPNRAQLSRSGHLSPLRRPFIQNNRTLVQKLHL